MSNPYCYTQQVENITPSAWHYSEHPTFFGKNNALESLLTLVSEQIPARHEADKPSIELVRLVKNMYWDFYNNGGGNSPHWSIYQPFSRALRQSGLPKGVCEALLTRLSLVFRYIGRGARFGWPRLGLENLLGYALECLLTDVVYYAAVLELPEALADFKRENPPPQSV
jgi:hypothetical protein